MSALSHALYYNAPMALDDTLTHDKGFEPEQARGRMEQHAKEAQEVILGPMPVQDFLGELVEGALDARGCLASRGAFAAVPASATSAKEIHGPLLSALNKATKHKSRCPGFTFVDVPSSIGLNNHTIACYASDCPSPISTADSPPLGFAELLVHVYADPAQDPFVDRSPSRPFLEDPETADMKPLERTLGHMMDQISELMARQHREFVFSVSVFGSRARLLRWDRAGCLVTESFDLHTHPEHLCDFLSRFSQTTPAGRGQDTNIDVALPEEEVMFKEAITRRVQFELGITGDDLVKAVSEHYAPGRVVAIHIVTVDPETRAHRKRRFIISRPVVSPSSLTGRCTRGFWAVDAVSGQVVFVKDTWRASDVDSEGATIARLLKVGVRNVPDLVCHGDIMAEGPGQVGKTLTDQYQQHAWYTRPANLRNWLVGQIHYRVVLGTVGYGLQRFRGSEELLHATYDAFQAMQDAYVKDSRIHRDISLGNILLVRDPSRAVRRGYLIDWEVSSRVGSDGKSLDRNRVGTWYYMSWRLLGHRDAVHTIRDDMESLIWVNLYCALRWLPHDLTMRTLRVYLHQLFTKATPSEDFTFGGEAKYCNILDRRYTHAINFGTSIRQWLTTAMDYVNPPPELVEEYKGRWADPSHLETYWAQLLSGGKIPPDDRVERPLDRPTKVENVVPLTASMARQAHAVSPCPSVKRADSVDGEAGSQPKRRKHEPTPQPMDSDNCAAAARRPRGRQAARASKRRPSRATPSQKAVSAEPRYSLRSASEVVSKYRRARSA